MEPEEYHWTDHLWTYLACGEQYRRRHGCGEIIPPGRFAVRGTGVHAAQATALRPMCGGQEPAPLEAAQQVARDAVYRAFSDGDYRLTMQERALKKDHVWRDKTIDEAVAFTGLYYKWILPEMDPVSVEREWRINARDWDFTLAGRMDVQNRGGGIDDLKTTGRRPVKRDADLDEQLTTYYVAQGVCDGKWAKPNTMRKLFLVKPAKRRPYCEIQETTRTREDVTRFLRLVQVCVEGIRGGHFKPVLRTPQTWWCSEMWCGYAETCPYFAGRRTFAMGG